MAVWCRNVLAGLKPYLRQHKKLGNFRKQNYSSIINMDDDGDSVPEGMKTKVNILSEEEEGIYVTSYSDVGFTLSTGVQVMGPCVLFPKSALHWNVSGSEDINESSLSIFPLLVPKLDILVIGVGDANDVQLVHSNAVKYLKTHKINFEILSTVQALPTFNFLNSERRSVAGAFIPPSFVQPSYLNPDIELKEDSFKVNKDFFYKDVKNSEQPKGLTESTNKLMDYWKKKKEAAERVDKKIKEKLGDSDSF